MLNVHVCSHSQQKVSLGLSWPSRILAQVRNHWKRFDTLDRELQYCSSTIMGIEELFFFLLAVCG